MVLHRINCIGKDVMQSGDGMLGKDMGNRMIIINDNDLPITVAEKIITATKPYNPTPLMQALCTTLTGIDTAADTIDMFDLEEIKEIADYLMTYYVNHGKGD